MLGRERDDQVAMDRSPGAAKHEQAAIRALRERRDGAFDLTGVAYVNGAQVHADRWRQRLDGAELAGTGRHRGIAQHRYSSDARRDLLEKLEPLSTDGIFVDGKAGGVSARPRLAVDVAARNRVTDTREDDRDGAGHLQQWRDGGAGRGQYDIGCERDQFGRVFAHGVGLAVAPPVFDPDVLPDDPARVLETLRERSQASLAFRVVRGKRREHADAPHTLALLPSRRDRPRSRRAAEQRDELAAPHIEPPPPRVGSPHPQPAIGAAASLTNGPGLF